MKIDDVELANVAVRASQYPTDGKPEFLLVGRSNVGKKDLARTSATPGKTQTLNFYLVNDKFYLIDVPGYGYAAVDKDTQQKFGMMIEEYLINRENLKRVFMLVDFRHKPTEDDLLMFNFIKFYKLDVTIVATKYDKVKQGEKIKQERLFNDTFELGENDDIVYFSSVTKKGREEIYDILNKCMGSK